MNSQRYKRLQISVSCLLAAILLALITSSCTSPGGSGQELRDIDVQLSWYHYAPFAGFYAADTYGLYEAAGLQVSYLEADPTMDSIQPVLTREVDFGVAGADVVMAAQARGEPLIAVAALLQHHPLVFVSKEELGIRSPDDMAGRTIRITEQVRPIVEAFLHRASLDSEQVELINLPSTLDGFDRGVADVWIAYRNSFAVTLDDEGYALNRIYPDDYGVHFYGEVLFVHQEMLDEQPEIVRSFVQATLAGYERVIQDPAAVGSLVSVFAPQSEPRLEERKWLETVPLILIGERQLGWIDASRWTAMQRTLIEYAGLPTAFSGHPGYTNQFVSGVSDSSGVQE